MKILENLKSWHIYLIFALAIVGFVALVLMMVGAIDLVESLLGK